MKTQIFCLALLAVLSTPVSAQRVMKVDKVNGTVIELSTDSVKRVYFEEPDAAVLAGLCPDSNHPHMIDLGIGTLWSCCNVGASAPEQYGNYYAWGETSPKSVYNWDTYRYWHNSNGDGYVESSEMVNIGSDISRTSYDAARANWGAPWRMPTLAECQALVNCSSEWTTLNGVYGRKFTGPNGGSVFLPAAGYRWDGGLGRAGDWGYYWSSTLIEGFPGRARNFNFGSGGTGWYGWSYRFNGHTVRPVR